MAVFLGNELVLLNFDNEDISTESGDFSAIGGITDTFVSGGFTWKYHDFISTGSGSLSSTFTVTNGVNPEAKLLVVGGGGGGGNGGGGAGAVNFVNKLTLTPGTYPIIVGAGGLPTGPERIWGGTSSALGRDAFGGASGATGFVAAGFGIGTGDAKSSGGGGTFNTPGGPGRFSGFGPGIIGGGGGGGMSSNGLDPVGDIPSAGGSGLSFNLKGDNDIILVGGGGGGGANGTRVGGPGGLVNGIKIGGNGKRTLSPVEEAQPGVNGTGSGGGGAPTFSFPAPGGSGRVIIVYRIA